MAPGIATACLALLLSSPALAAQDGLQPLPPETSPWTMVLDPASTDLPPSILPFRVRTSGGTWVFRFRSVPGGKPESVVVVLPAQVLAGRRIGWRFRAAAPVLSPRPSPWNGVKSMLHTVHPTGEDWPQVAFPDTPFALADFRGATDCPRDATRVEFVLGLEAVTGIVEFSRIELWSPPPRPIPPPVPEGTIPFTGHGPGALRGAMVSPSTLDRTGWNVLTRDWKANLVRWQLIRPADSPRDTASWEAWLEKELARFDQALEWARQTGTMLVLDMHSPPGDGRNPGGYQDATGSLWTDPSQQDCLIRAWRYMARRYRGDGRIWGFDLVNEPVDTDTAPECLDWQDLSLAIGKAVREEDPERTLIVEPHHWGGVQGFATFLPLPLERVVYSVHVYDPAEFTFQGINGTGETPSWPGTMGGRYWDKAALSACLAPVRDFARTWKVHVYVGEFSAIRWADGADRWLRDAIGIFGSEGWDWSYHAFREWQGWSLEHSGPPDAPVPRVPPDRRLPVLLQAWARNGG